MSRVVDNMTFWNANRLNAETGSDVELVMNLLGERRIAYSPLLAQTFGGVTAGLFLSQLLWWHTVGGSDPDGWIYKTQSEWTKETAMTRREQETARTKLKDAGVLEEKLAGAPATVHFRVNVMILHDILLKAATQFGVKRHTDSNSPTKPPNQNVGKSHTGMAESANLLHKEKTTKKTTEKTLDKATPSFVQITMDTLESVRGYPSGSYGAEAKAVKAMEKLGYATAEIMACYVEKKNDPWWQQKPLTMMSVKSAIGEWKKHSQPVEAVGEKYARDAERLANRPVARSEH